MKKDQWIELVEWVDDRWATRTWNDEQARAYYADLKNMDATDVWDAIYHLYAEGREYPPTGSILMNKTRDIYVTRLRAEAAQALPEPAADPDGSMQWGDWAHKIGHTGRTLPEAIKESHARQFPKGCGRAQCDVHAEATA